MELKNKNVVKPYGKRRALDSYSICCNSYAVDFFMFCPNENGC